MPQTLEFDSDETVTYAGGHLIVHTSGNAPVLPGYEAVNCDAWGGIDKFQGRACCKDHECDYCKDVSCPPRPPRGFSVGMKLLMRSPGVSILPTEHRLRVDAQPEVQIGILNGTSAEQTMLALKELVGPQDRVIFHLLKINQPGHPLHGQVLAIPVSDVPLP